MKISMTLAAVLAATVFAGGSAQAAAILSPVSVTVTRGGVANSFFSITNVINQAGLSKTYVPGVTQFEEFIASQPTHLTPLGTRWLSAGSVDSATLTFDFGKEVTLAQFAWWDDASTTNRSLRLSTPTQPSFRQFNVTDRNTNPSTAEVFSFSPVTTRYLTIDISGCNLGIGTTSNWTGCGLHEVVFAEGVIGGGGGGVPEPATWAMMTLGFAAMGAVIRRRRTVLA